jgi:hypothetical protein
MITATELLSEVKRANIPEEIPGQFGNEEFTTQDGWKITIFYDCGEFDYIDKIVTPEGQVYEYPFSEFITEDGNPIQAYRG